MTSRTCEPARAGRRLAAKGLLAAAAVSGGLIVAAQAAHAKPKPIPKPKIEGDTLVVHGTDAAEQIAFRLAPNDPDRLEIDVDADGRAEFKFKRSKFTRITVDLFGADDVVNVDNANGAFTDTERMTVDGGDGHDAMVFNASGASEHFDVSDVAGFARFLREGDIELKLNHLEQIDLAALGGADTLVVNALSGTDVVAVNGDLEAGDGEVDSVVVNGTGGDDAIAVSGTEGSSIVAGLSATINVTGVEAMNDELSVNGLGGNDALDASALAAYDHGYSADGGEGDDTLFGAAGNHIVEGGDGDDTIQGGAGSELLLGGAGNDFVDGGGGNDGAYLGAGDDAFQWDPGEGSDVVEGDDGHDVMVFNGNEAGERFEVADSGGFVRFLRNLGNIEMTLGTVEQIDLDALGGADTLVVNRLSAAALLVNADLESALGSGAGDGQADFIAVNGTDGDDAVTVTGTSGSSTVNGLDAVVNITRAEPTDVLLVNGRGGNDAIDASALTADAIGFGAAGGEGDDTLLGGAGRDSLLGDAGNDFADGNRGDDSAFMGAGNDTFQWDPGDGSDIVSGEDGHDVMLFNGSGASESFVASADGFGGAVFTRDIGNITMALDRVEQINLDALGGADTLLVDDLSDFRGTGVETISADLEGVKDSAAGDGQPDSILVNGTNGDDSVVVSGGAGSATVSGLAVTVNVAAAEPADRLTVNGLAGDDAIDATALAAGVLGFFADGGADNDTLLGGAGDEVLAGGHGADVVFGGSGDNVLFGNAGDDVLRGEEGDDVLDGGDGEDILIGGAGDDVLLNGEVVFDE